MLVNQGSFTSHSPIRSQESIIREHKLYLNVEDVRINRELTDSENLLTPSQKDIDDMVYEHYKASMITDPLARQRRYEHTDILGHYETKLSEMTEKRKQVRDFA
jgi:hypothetical protein